MRKVVPPLRWSCGALSALALAACGEPSYTRVAVIEPTDTSEAGAMVREDGGRRDGSADLTGCVVLPENSAAIASSTGAVTVSDVNALGCDLSDAGTGTGPPFLANNVFERHDGQPLVRAQQRYSFRWSGLLVLTRVRIYGGDDTCPAVPLIDLPVGPFTPAFTLPTCQEFTPEVDAQRLLLFGADFLLGAQSISFSDPLNFTLCPSGCPVNSQPSHAQPDAGTGDAGFQVPSVPSVPWDGAVPLP